MSWVLEGEKVSGMYLGEFPVTGKVYLSRVKFGGEVSHHIELDMPLHIYGSVRDAVILNHKEITQIHSKNA